MPGSRALALFELCDHLFARAADAPEIVEPGVEAVANVAAVAHKGAGIVDQAAIDVVAHIDEIVERADERPGERRLAGVEHEPHARHDRNRLLQADEIARARIAERRARDKALEILHMLSRPRETCRGLCCERRTPRRRRDGRGCDRARQGDATATSAADARP